MANDRRITWRVTNVVVNDAHGSNAVDLDVYYSKGGINYFSGGYTKAGYYFSVLPIKDTGDGCTSFTMGHNVGKAYLLAEASRFNAKKLAQYAAPLKPHSAAIIEALIERDYDGIKGIVTATVLATVPIPTLVLKTERRQEA